MTPETSRCDGCGTELAPSEAEGLCPRCLIGLAFASPGSHAAVAAGGIPSGARVGPYEIVSLISHGGMGEVYRARDTRLDRIVAIKFLRRVWSTASLAETASSGRPAPFPA